MERLYLVYGTGISGKSAATLLSKQNKKCILFDENISAKDPLLDGVSLYKGELPKEIEDAVTDVVLSPGVPTDIKRVSDWREKGINIIGEIELAYECGKGTCIGITGTNGKTTTTALTGEIIKSYYDSVFVVGNIGIPYTQMCVDTKDDSVVVAEISSFQLETIKDFRPHISAILNITPDHLDRHHTMEAYIKAKEDITSNQTKDDICVLNYDDEVLREFGKKLDCKVIFFSSNEKLNEGLYLEDGFIVYNKTGKKISVIKTSELNILGKHNYENAMAAIAMSDAMNVPLDKIQMSLKNFLAVEHRIEYVCDKSGISFYNDSKGTNTDASIKAIEAMERPTVLIAGGYDKGADYTDFIKAFDDRIKKLVLIGATANAIAKTADENGYSDYVFCKDLKEAVEMSYDLAQNGDAVLLSPACASWDMFKNFNERGDLFKEYVKALKE